MTHNPTDPHLVADTRVRRPKVDQGVYLRTYAVINSIDRSERSAWWERVVERAKELPDFLMPMSSLVAIAAPAQERRVLAAGVEDEPTEMVLVRPSAASVSPDSLSQQLQSRTPLASWAFLALIAVFAAGLTFALIRVAWTSIISA